MNGRNPTGWVSLSLICMVGLGLINIWIPLWMVPKFEKIYEDALPGKPLPAITNFVLSARYFLAVVAAIWMVAAAIPVYRHHRFAGWIVYSSLVFFATLIGLTVFALFIPMTSGIITGMLGQ